MKSNQSFSLVWSAFINSAQSANKLVPGIVVITVLLAAVVISVCLLSVYLMIGAALLLVLFASTVVFATTHNYGEATLSLVAGLLTVFTVEWTSNRFIAFSVVWIAFSLFALLISSISLAAKQETIYVHAATSLFNSDNEIRAMKAKLEEIGKKPTPLGQLGPLQRAEVVRILVFRKIPIDALPDALKVVEILSIVTK